MKVLPFNRVLILSASAGAGHMRAADALEHAFKKARAATDVRHLDVLQLTNKLFRRLYSKAYIDLVNSSPELLGWFYDYLDTPGKHDQRRLILDRLNTRPMVKFQREHTLFACRDRVLAQSRASTFVPAGNRRH
jgi:processive 1,2-diacylglycerol beta-glucosyltransferase